MRNTKILLGVIGLLFFSGCSWSDIPFVENDNSEKKSALIYVELEGEIISEQSSQFAFSEYFLINQQREKVAHLTSNTEDLSEFSGKNVVLKGEKIDSSQALLQLKVVQIGITFEKTQVIHSKKMGIDLPLSKEYLYEISGNRIHIIQKKSGEKFCTFFHQGDVKWQQKFLDSGEKIVIQDFDVRRIYAGNRIQLYFPIFKIQVTYWEKKDSEYDFYSLLDKLSLSSCDDREYGTG